MGIRYKTKSGTIELPKLTMRLSDMTDEVEVAADTRERFKLQLDFLAEVLPAEAIAELLDGDELDSIDLVALGVTYNEVVQAYAAPIIESQAQGLNGQLKAVRPALDALDSIKAAQGRQGFKAVK